MSDQKIESKFSEKDFEQLDAGRLDLVTLQRTLPRIESLLSLVAFYEQEDMVHAAAALGLTQPALSQQLKKLKETLGFDLFTFQGKRKILTRMGVEYVKVVKNCLNELQSETSKILKLAQRLEDQTIRVAGRRELLLTLLGFHFPGKIEWIQTSSDEAIELLRHRKVDLAVGSHLLDSKELIERVIFESSMKLIWPKSWGTDCEPKSLLEKPMIAYGPHPSYLKEFSEAFQIPYEKLKIRRQIEDWYGICELVRLGQGWSVIPQTWGIHSDDVLQKAIPEQNLHSQRICLFYLTDELNSAWVRNLETWLTQAFATS